MPCRVRDEGRSLGIGLQDQIPNHLKLLGPKAPVVSVQEKAGREPVRCGPGRRTQVNRRGGVESVGTSPKPGASRWPGTQPRRDLLTDSVVTGIKAARSRSGLSRGTWDPGGHDDKGKPQGEDPRGRQYQGVAQGRINP